MKARKKPVEIECILLEPTQYSLIRVEEFIEGKKIELTSNVSSDKFDYYFELCQKQGGRIIKTLEGEMLASWGDYIIKGVNGEFYPCKPDIFLKTYDIIL